MKIWMRLLAGIVVGTILALYLPESGGDTADVFSRISRLVVSIARYSLFPLLFFGVLMGTTELIADRKTLRVYGKAIGLLAAASFVAALIGAAGVVVLAPGRIPPIFQEAPAVEAIDAYDLAMRVFPTNFFEAIVAEGSFLLPVVVAALIFGMALSRERAHGEALTSVLEGTTRVFYRISAFIVDILAIGIVAVAAYLIFQIREINDIQIFGQVFLILGISIIVVVFLIYPLILYLLVDRENPYVWVYAMLSPALTAIASGDLYAATPTLVRMGRENLGMRRSVGSAVVSLAAIFGRAGTTLVTTASFLVILQSYTALEITFGQVVWVVMSTFGIGFLLGASPATGVLIGLSMLAGAFGRGMEEVFLILLPALPILTSLAAFMDVMTAGFVLQLVGSSERLRRRVELLDFV
ncbi:MAG: dicarboxylate/amino acid:cation symporter [bacterium]